MKKFLLSLAVLLTAVSAEAENYILYTSTDESVAKVKEADQDGNLLFGAKIVSNTYEDGQGKIVFDGEVTKFGNESFARCSRLATVEIPKSVTTIGERAFLNCTRLAAIAIPKSVTSIAANAFRTCKKVESITVEDGNANYFADSNCLITTDGLLIYAIDKEVIEIPSSVKKIGEEAFLNWSKMTEVKLPESVVEIGSGAFTNCTNLLKINIPQSVTAIESQTFYSCQSLATIEIPASVKTLGQGAFMYSGLTDIELPKSLTTIEDAVFSGCQSLTKVTIPNSVTTICPSAFFQCTGLTEIEIPESVTSIGKSAFANCTSLKKVKLPESLTTLESYLFGWCESLKEIIIPKTVTKIENEAFAGTHLSTIYSLNTTPPTISANSFDELTAHGCMLKVPAQSFETYKAAEHWSNFWYINPLTDQELEALGVETLTQNPKLNTQNLFNLQGQEVGEDYKGIVIRGGKKMLRK